MKEIYIFVRHCKFSSNSVGKDRPPWFTREGCFNNLLNTRDGNCDVNICFDGKLEGSGHFLEKDYYYDSFLVHEKIGGNDGASFLNVLETVHDFDFKDDDIIYFLEDDYLHNINWPKILREGFEETSADYVTLYDHNDKYTFSMYSDLVSQIMATKSCHWRNIPSTTNTYACLGKTFRKDYEIHKQFCNLTRGFTQDNDKFLELGKMNRSLISSIPGYSTHCEPAFMSPVVDWEKVFKNTSHLKVPISLVI